MGYSYDRTKQAAKDPEVMAVAMGHILTEFSEMVRDTRTQFRQAEAAEELRALWSVAHLGYQVYSRGGDFIRLKEDIEAKIQKLEAKAMAGGKKFDLSAQQLELYDKPGANRAAKAISNGLTKAAKAMLRGLDKLKDDYVDDRDYAKANKIIYGAYTQYVEPILSKYNDLGAGDTEPRQVCRSRLERLAKGVLGADQWSRIEI